MTPSGGLLRAARSCGPPRPRPPPRAGARVQRTRERTWQDTLDSGERVHQFGPLDELRARAEDRTTALRERGVAARLYGEDPGAQPGTGGLHAFFRSLSHTRIVEFDAAAKLAPLALRVTLRRSRR